MMLFNKHGNNWNRVKGTLSLTFKIYIQLYAAYDKSGPKSEI